MTRQHRLSLRFALMVLSCALIMTACSTKEEKVASFIAAGDRLLAEKDPVRAILEYKNALQIDPKSARATSGLGKAYLQQHEYQKAYATFKAALELDADLDESRVEVAWVLAMGKKGEPALLEIAQLRRPEAFQPKVDLIKARAKIAGERHREAVEILSQVPDANQNIEVQRLLIIAYQSLNDHDKMEQAVVRWRGLDPADPNPYLILGQNELKRGRKAQALDQLRQMVEAAADKAVMSLLRAKVLERWDLPDEAEAAFESLPASPENRLAQVDFWLRAKNRQKARATLESLVADSPENSRAVVMLAQMQSDEKDPETAFQLIESTLKRDLKKPEREQLVLAKATLLARQADWEAARKLGEGVLAENQGNMDAHLLLGKVLLNTHNPAEAEIHLNQVGLARPKDEQVQLLLVRSQVLNKKEALAADTLKRAVEANPESTRLRLQLVSYYLHKGDQEQVARVLGNGLEVQPTSLSLLKTAGDFEANRKNFPKAEEYFRKILEMHPELPLGYQQMGQLMLVQTRSDDAVSWFNQALARKDGWQKAIPALARTFFAQKKPDQARALVRREAAERPDSPLAWFFLGQVMQATGDLPEAEKAFARAAELAPQWPDAYRGLAEAFLRQGKLEEAIARFETAYQQQASLPIRMQLAMLYDLAGRPDDAIGIYRELLKEAGTAPPLLNNLAYLYAEHRSDKETLAEANRLAALALEREPENPALLDTAAWIAYKQGDYDAAWKNAQDSLALAPEVGLHNLHAAIILQARGEKDQALDYLNKSLSVQMDPKSKEKAEALKLEWAR